MTISSSGSTISYAGNGVTRSFAFPYEYLVGADFVVTVVVEATSVVTTLVYGTDYTVNPSTNSPANTGSILTTVPVASGSTITITRVTPLTQETTWQINDSYPANFYRIENALDKLTNALQETRDGSISDVALGTGVATYSTFLRGANATADDERVWSNTLIGSLGAAVLAADTTAVFTAQQSANASIRVGAAAGDQASYSFAVDGSANPWEMKWVYDDGLGKLGWQVFGGPILGTFDASGIDVTGTVNATLFTGNAAGSLITSGQVLPQFLASNASGNAAQFLNGVGQFAVPAGGGGINTTTTGTFTIAAVNSTQVVPVTSATGIVPGTELLIGDGTHAIIGHVTVVASLNVTVSTDSIPLGTAGNTMASGASVQASAYLPGNNTIQVGDTANPAATASRLTFVGSAAGRPLGISNVSLYLDSVSGSSMAIAGYANASFTIGSVGAATTVHDLIAFKPLGNTQWTFLGTSTQGGVLHADTTTTLAFSKITASDSVTNATITPVLLNATNSQTTGYVPSTNGAGQFTWVPNGGSIPGGGDAGKFFRGDNTFSNILDLSHDSGAESIGLTLSQGVTNGSFGSTFGSAADGSYSFWIMQKRVSGSWGTPASVYCNYQIGTGIDHGVLSVGASWVNPDGSNVERFFTDGLMRTSAGLRSVYGPFSQIFEISAPSSPLALDLVNGAYQRISSLGVALTLTLADTTTLPTSLRYESELTLELNLSNHDIAWPGTITWANGGVAPTIANGALNATGINIVRLLRRQGQTQWVGFVENPAASATYTDAQARSAVLNSTYLLDSSSIGWTISPGTSATPAVKNGSITNAMLAGNIATSKLVLPGGTTTFLAANGSWLVPPGTGGGGGGFNPNVPNSFGAKQTFSGPQVFTSNGFGGTVGTNAVAQITFNNYFPNDNVSPSLATAQKTTFVNSFNGGSTQEILALNILQTNKATASGEGEGCMKVWNDVWKDITFGFAIGFQALTSARRVNGGNADGVWLNSFSPCAQFSSTPDADGITHSFGSGAVRIGECNYGNSWADLGFIDDRGGGHYVAGLEFFPAWIAGTTGATSFTQFPASWAIAIGAANGGPLGGPATNWTGILLSENSIVPGGLGVNMHGGNISTTTTGTFTIAAVGASQTVAVTATTNMSAVAGSQSALQITDGTHTILGHVTGIASLNLTFVTDFIIAGTAGNTMASAAIVTAGPGVGINLQSQFTTGINFAGSGGGAPIGSGGGAVATFTSTGAAAITLAVDQSIKFGPIWVRGHGSGSGLQYSTNGTSWTDFTLP